MLSHIVCKLITKAVETNIWTDLPSNIIIECKNCIEFFEIQLNKNIDDLMFDCHASFDSCFFLYA